jgi:hypothetical protein
LRYFSQIRHLSTALWNMRLLMSSETLGPRAINSASLAWRFLSDRHPVGKDQLRSQPALLSLHTSPSSGWAWCSGILRVFYSTVCGIARQVSLFNQCWDLG